MLDLGYDPLDVSIDPLPPTGIGNRAAASLLEFRHGDGSNQLGGYADTTGYAPVNAVMDVRGRSIPRRFATRVAGSPSGS